MRRSRRLAGREPSLDDNDENDDARKTIQQQLVTFGYGEEQAHEIAFSDDEDTEFMRTHYIDLRSRGFDHEQVEELCETGHDASAISVFDHLLELGFEDCTSEFTMLYFRVMVPSAGYDALLRGALFHTGGSICKAVSALEKLQMDESTKIFVGTAFGNDDNDDEILLHDDNLLPVWQKLSSSLSHVPTSNRGYIQFICGQVQLSKEVTDMLLPLKTVPLKSLMFMRNDLGRNGYKFVTGILEQNESLEIICIVSNPVESKDDTTTLVQALIKHPTVDYLYLEKCDLGKKNAVFKTIIPALCLEAVSLRGNSVGTYGAMLLSRCLSRNPDIKYLYLEDNLFDDEDAFRFAESLQTNTNLRVIHLSGNNFTKIGVRALRWAVSNFYAHNLNAVYDSNHTCMIADLLPSTNHLHDPRLNLKTKILSVLHVEYTNIAFLGDISLELMPEVLFYIQGQGFMDPSKHNVLQSLFQLLRQWSLPLLYSSKHLGFEPRRSSRIRKKIVNQYKTGKRKQHGT